MRLVRLVEVFVLVFCVPCLCNNFFDLLRFLCAGLLFEIGNGVQILGSFHGSIGGEFKSPHAACKITNVDIFTLRTELSQGCIEAEEIVLVQPARATAAQYVLGKLLGILRTDKLLVIRRANVDERSDGGRAVGRMEWRIVDGIAVDLSNIKILLDFCDVVGFDSVGHAPYLIGSRIVVIGELFPVRPFNESNYSAGSFWSSSMILTGAAVGLALEQLL